MTLAPQITFRNMETSAKLEETVLTEAGKLERFFPRIMSCRVAIEKPKEYGRPFRVRIDLGVPGAELVVEQTPTLHAGLQDIDVERKTKESEPHRERRDARRAIHEAFHEMRRRLQDYVRVQKPREQAKEREGLLIGKVIRLSPDEGFGFLETPEGQDVYFHRNSVLGGQFDRLRVGSPVRFAVETGEKGPQASTVRLVRPVRQRQRASETVLVSRRGRRAAL